MIFFMKYGEYVKINAIKSNFFPQLRESSNKKKTKIALISNITYLVLALCTKC